MISLDTNILLYSLNPRSQWNAQAVAFLKRCLSQERVVFTDYVLVELHGLLRNPQVMKRPLSAGSAVEVVRGYFKYPTVTRVESAPVMDEVWDLAAQPGAARRRIFDVRLGLTLLHHGVTRFATANVKDFENLGFERVWNPLLD